MTTIPATIDLNPASDHPEGSVIWLHGLGADANDFVPIVEQFKIPDQYKIRFVFPNAPIRPITINNGMLMRAWYDIEEIDLSAKEDEEGIQASATLVEHLIEREMGLGIKSERIILAGFSQGGAIALYTGLRCTKPLGGIIALSTYLPLANHLNADRQIINQSIPIYMAHGLFDPVVPLMLGEMTRQQLESLGYKIDWHTYSMPHSVTPEEIDDIGHFIKNVFSAQVFSSTHYSS